MSLKIYTYALVVFFSINIISVSKAEPLSIYSSCTANINEASEDEVLVMINCLKEQYKTTLKVANAVLTFTRLFESRLDEIEETHKRCKRVEQYYLSYKEAGKLIKKEIEEDYFACQTTIPKTIEDLGKLVDNVKYFKEDNITLKDHHDELKGKLRLIKLRFGKK